MSSAMNNSVSHSAAAAANASLCERANAAFQEHLVAMFQLPADLALARVNASLSADGTSASPLPRYCVFTVSAARRDAVAPPR